MAGGIYLNNLGNTSQNSETLQELQEIVGEENAKIVEM